MHSLPCILHEDEHLLVVNKPAGWNTHAPSPYAGEGIYDWLRHREPRWKQLAIIHRLDKVTSGVLVFAKTKLANQSLSRQFETRTVRKSYELLSDLAPGSRELECRSYIHRSGERYASGKGAGGCEFAHTRFRLLSDQQSPPFRLLAEPLTGRTHQIRVHAAEAGFPILGDELYGGSPAQRVCLHAVEICLEHPESGDPVRFTAPADFMVSTGVALRKAIIEPGTTDCFRIVHGSSDDWRGWYVDRLGDYLLAQSTQTAAPEPKRLDELARSYAARAVYHKRLSKQVRRTELGEASPELVTGEPAPGRFVLRENGARFHASFQEGYSVGLFLDQRDNRRRLLQGAAAAEFPFFEEAVGEPEGEGAAVLNLFAYTCGFSVCAAIRGRRTVSVDLSRKYLEWGQENFRLNGLDPSGHEFLCGDAFDWLRRFRKRDRRFGLVLLDPPTFSKSKVSGIFRVRQDFGRLVEAATGVLEAGGVLFCSTNCADWAPEAFLAAVDSGLKAAGRKRLKQIYYPQPPDFPASPGEPVYLKTAWVKVA